MRRREILAAMLVFSGVGLRRTSQAGNLVMLDAAPEKIRLIPDEWHIRHVGRLSDGRLFFVDGQLHSSGGITKYFACTFLFNADGGLVEHTIELLGARDSFPKERVAETFNRHLALLQGRVRTDIWIRPFAVESNGAVFGLIPRKISEGNWRVEFMPGNTLSFYPPWEAGEYDT